jgi:methyltransferase (TIGR00027 family)
MRVPLLRRELHTTDRPSSTAQWTTLGRALELGRPGRQRIVSDEYAPIFLSQASERLLTLLRRGESVVRSAERREFAGLAVAALCRHRFIDEQLLASLPNVEQIVILGAGYDSRAYRFRRPIGGRPVYEVDLPPISRHKGALIAARPDVFDPSSVRRVEIDFRTQSLADRLMHAGFQAGAATTVVWEGVAMYLTRDAVRGTISALAKLCGAGSVLAMDCWRHVGGFSAYDLLRRLGEHAIRLVGEPLTFMATPAELTDLLAQQGYPVSDLATSDELTQRFATDGRRCDEVLYTLAAMRSYLPPATAGLVAVCDWHPVFELGGEDDGGTGAGDAVDRVEVADRRLERGNVRNAHLQHEGLLAGDKPAVFHDRQFRQ